MAAAAARFGKAVGSAVVKAGEDKASTWFTPHMAAASGAILDRIPLVDFTLEVRDARIPVSSQYQLMRKFPSSRRIIVLNKTDLADRSQTQEWIRHFHKENCICYGINSHNKDNIKEFLNFVQANVRELNSQQSKFTTTVMLVGIPNVGKSALANSLHQIGRISAAEKGKLKHATVSPLPGETKDITSLKAGADRNCVAMEHKPLHGAAQSGVLEYVSCLLEAGADPNFLDNNVLSEAIPSYAALFIGNSMVVRDADMYGRGWRNLPTQSTSIISSRGLSFPGIRVAGISGASGIGGLLRIASGFAVGNYTRSHSTSAAEGGHVSLVDVVESKNSSTCFWVEITPGVLRATVFYRRMIRQVYILLREHKYNCTGHGNLKAEHITYAVYNVEEPILINQLDGCADVRKDFTALRKIMQYIFQVTGDMKTMDGETMEFMSFLDSANAGQKHYWFMDAIDRERFFCDIRLSCRDDLKQIFTGI